MQGRKMTFPLSLLSPLGAGHGLDISCPAVGTEISRLYSTQYSLQWARDALLANHQEV